jgi:cytochrome oxidase Cu insertion factor (SCO1/SenC/PrrC family)
VGLTGSWEDIKQTCKYFRVYFSTPPNVKPGQDYLVDHSIFFYLMGISLEMYTWLTDEIRRIIL